jgi:hypothetical protein
MQVHTLYNSSLAVHEENDDEKKKKDLRDRDRFTCLEGKEGRRRRTIIMIGKKAKILGYTIFFCYHVRIGPRFYQVALGTPAFFCAPCMQGTFPIFTVVHLPIHSIAMARITKQIFLTRMFPSHFCYSPWLDKNIHWYRKKGMNNRLYSESSKDPLFSRLL